MRQVLNFPPGLGFSPPVIVSDSPRKYEPPFTDGRFDALATCHLKGLRVREGGVVGTRWGGVEKMKSDNCYCL